ncbi:RNA polymerase factor sigma-54 [Rossellomorea aquimaris]|uniref:RNA polymerase factor sigma-54 n=1 Tax=Rossellomorea aquimaris TaxID=189382 RepID=UPI001CD66420|nr:RNA polymerase factor sigma-54 [Rossellomorea aquimaris]MCA1055404.1 RNA polymerase factor sigma-54 [Rossellomorea aquimaris]
MNLNTGLWQKQQMKLQMTQQLSQAITILQYSTMELNAFLTSKALENPLIQLEDPIMDIPHRGESYSYKTKEKKDFTEFVSASKETLVDHLFLQLDMKSLSSEDLRIMKELLYSLDENGYLHIEEEEFIKRANVQKSRLYDYIDRLQELEPAGVGARSLQECILLQLWRKRDSGLAITIVEDHFNDFAMKKWKGIAKQLNVGLKEIQLASDLIQQCNPRPGAEYTNGECHYIVPELIVKIIGPEEVKVSLFDGTTIKVNYNEEYQDFLEHHPDEEVKRYLREKEQEFQWLLQSLQQRKQTMLKVGKLIVKKQKSFFLKGPAFIQPLTLKEVAQEAGLHESTISRAVKGKYMQTPYGIFEMKYFFSAAIKSVHSEADGAASSTSIKNEIQRLVEEEDKKKPLSDQKIVNMLIDKGYDVSRRTIAKYRDQLGISSSTMRKRYE